MANTSPLPSSYDKVMVETRTVIKPWPNGQGQDHVSFFMASFTDCDRPRLVLGFGATEEAAVAALYAKLADES